MVDWVGKTREFNDSGKVKKKFLMEKMEMIELQG
jgi:hypothetical protein